MPADFLLPSIALNSDWGSDFLRKPSEILIPAGFMQLLKPNLSTAPHKNVSKFDA